MGERKSPDKIPEKLVAFAEHIHEHSALYGVVMMTEGVATFEGESLIERQEVTLRFKPLTPNDPRSELSQGWIEEIARGELHVLMWINQTGESGQNSMTPVEIKFAVYRKSGEIEEASFKVVLY